MITAAANRLEYLLETLPQRLHAITEADFDNKPGPGQWSRKQILGHLIDSAANNHHRLIRACYEDNPLIRYDQDKWNTLNQYEQAGQNEVITFWEIYNRHLLRLIKNMPEELLSKTCNTGGKEPVTLQWLIDDYVVHMEHHLKQIVNY